VIRRNRITGDPVIVAPERAQRPNAFGGDAPASCPFCPGHEHETPPEVARDGDPWRVRVFPNKYPATPQHEIVVEAAAHNARFEDLAGDHAAAVVDVWFARYRHLASSAAAVTIFKNEGRAAGASIEHLHSQILGTPFVPPRMAREGYAFACATRCPLCALDDEPLIAESEHYLVVAPRGAAYAFEQWIVPKAHAPVMHEPHDLATLLRPAARASREVAGAFNWAFINFPQEPSAHWYVAITPRLGGIAGYEIGGGGAVNIVDADEAVARLQRQYSGRS